MKNKTTSLHCGNVLIIREHYDPRCSEVIIYYKNDDNEGNKEVNDIRIGFGYTRKSLKPFDEFRELKEAFIKYKRRGVYIRDNTVQDREADKERRDNIRKVPPLQSNDINGN